MRPPGIIVKYCVKPPTTTLCEHSLMLSWSSRTCAVASVGSQGEAGFADALEAAVLVDAHAVQAHVGGGALVMV